MNFLGSQAKMEPTQIITALLIALCSLAALDLWRQYAIRGELYWFERYVKATKTNVGLWTMGFRLEDLEGKLFAEESRLKSTRSSIELLSPDILHIQAALRAGNHQNKYDFLHSRRSIDTLHHLMHNDTSIFRLRCEADGPYVRVGVNDFRTDPRDSCQLFTGPTDDNIGGPEAMFELIPFEEDSFGLRSISSGYFVKAVGPPQDHTSLPWKLVVAGPVAGAEERFRLTDEGYLYSSVIGTIEYMQPS